MSLWSTFCGWFSWSDAPSPEDGCFSPCQGADGTTNPATGLPCYGGVDIMGNPYGVDLSSFHDQSSSSVNSECGSGISESHSPFWLYED